MSNFKCRRNDEIQNPNWTPLVLLLTTDYGLLAIRPWSVGLPHSPLPTPHSPLPTPHSPLPAPHSPLPAPHSPLRSIPISDFRIPI